MRKVLAVALVLLLCAGAVGCTSIPSSNASLQVNTESPAPEKKSSIGYLREQLMKKGTKTKYGYELSKGDNEIKFTIGTDENRGWNADGKTDQGSLGVKFEYEMVVKGVRHTYEIAVYEGHERYWFNYFLGEGDETVGLGSAQGQIIPKEYPSSICYIISSETSSSGDVDYASLIPSATPVLLAGIDTILKDNDISLTVSDFGFASK